MQISGYQSTLNFGSGYNHYSIRDLLDDPEEIGTEIGNENRIAQDEPVDFYRDHELFNKRYDVVTPGYSRYDSDDVPHSDAILLRKIPKDKRYPYKIDSDDMCSFKLIRTGDTIYLSDVPEYIDNKMDQYTFDELGNVYYESFVGKDKLKHSSTNMVKEALTMLDLGYPIEYTVETMQKAKLERFKDKAYSNGLITFLSKYPDKRNVVVRGTEDHYEYFDPTSAKYYDKFYNLCDNSEEAEEALSLCILRNIEHERYADDTLCSVVEFILENSGKLDEDDKTAIKNTIFDSGDCQYTRIDKRQELWDYTYRKHFKADI